jgi:3,4-dihydroxy 2-butanone 4-phosphate synthase/GTP cyclohydrolase II
VTQPIFDSVEEALKAFSNGEPIVVVDDEHRENEGDIVFAASQCTPDKINFCIQEGGGLVCVALGPERTLELGLNKVPSNKKDPLSTAFLDSVDAVQSHGVSTGISASDRSITTRLLASSGTLIGDFSVPGHVFPLRAVPGGLLARRGHTEAAVDLCKLTQQSEAAVICEILDKDGTMLRRQGLRSFSDRHGLKMISIEQLHAYLEQQPLSSAPVKLQRLCHRVSASSLQTKYGEFTIQVYKSIATGVEHSVLSQKNNLDAKPVLRLHSECQTGDVFGSLRCDCGDQLQSALKKIAEIGHGHLVYLKGQEGRGIGLGNKIAAYSLQEKGLNTYEANEQLGYPIDARHYAEAADIVAQLGLDEFVLMTNNPDKVAALTKAGFAFEVDSIPVRPNAHNLQYLTDKKILGQHHITFES